MSTPHHPGSASWISLVERFFALLTPSLSGAGHTHRPARRTALAACIAARNTAPHPLLWVRFADAILVAVERFCLAQSPFTSNRHGNVGIGTSPGPR